MRFLDVDVIHLMDTSGNLTPTIIGNEEPVTEVKDLLNANRLSVIRDFDQDIAYIFDYDGPLMCKQMNYAVPQVIPDQIVCGVVAVVKLEILKTWRLRYL